MEISDNLLCLFNAELTATDEGHVVEVPESEIDTGSLEPGETYRVALISTDAVETETKTETGGRSSKPTTEPQPPVEPGEIRYVEIEDIGKQGDGIARVERGYVIIVPNAEIGEQVKVEISQVKSNFAVGDIIDETV